MANTSSTYKAAVYMPIIVPPLSSPSPQTYYADVLAATTFAVAPTMANKVIDITTSNAATGMLYAMTGGFVSFIPTAQPVPASGGLVSTPEGTLALKCAPADVLHLKKVLPLGVPPMAWVYYMNVEEAAVRAALAPNVAAINPKVIEAEWLKNNAASADAAAMQQDFMDRFILGERQIFVAPGDLLGAAAPSVSGNPLSDRKVTLVMADAAGNGISPVLHLSRMPSYEDVRWTGHPLAVQLIGVPTPVDFHLKFEMWNGNTGSASAYDKLPSGVAVDMMHHNHLLTDTVLQTKMIDPNGQVHFSFTNSATLEAMVSEQPDIYFRVRPNGVVTTPAGWTEWSTKGWLATDGTPGYLEDFAGTQVGDAVNPVVFRVGLDIHIRLELKHGVSGAFIPAPLGIPVRAFPCSSPPGSAANASDYATDANGEVHALIFGMEGGDDLYFHIEFEMTDATIGLPRARVHLAQSGWSTFWDDADKTTNTFYPDLDRTSVGGPSAPARLRCTINDRNFALYALKVLREVSTFFSTLSNGDWTGIPNLTLFRTAAAGTAYSWPIGEVNIPPISHWNRKTLIHEISHQVMWKEADFNALNIGWEFLGGELHSGHNFNYIINPEHALIEGWAAFVEAALTHTGSPTGFAPPYPLTSLVDANRVPVVGGLGPPPPNRGESGEGAFANGLWEIFRHHVVGGPCHIPETSSGNIRATSTVNTYMSDPAVRARFISMIWEPLKDLDPIGDPTTTHMLNAIKTRNAVDWPAIKARLNAFNMAI